MTLRLLPLEPVDKMGGNTAKARPWWTGFYLWHALRVRLLRRSTLPLSEAVEAHRQLEGRQTTGKVLLMP